MSVRAAVGVPRKGRGIQALTTLDEAKQTEKTDRNGEELLSKASHSTVTSATYALAVGKLDDVIPETIRPTNSHATLGAIAITR
jgi:hypothetical protein